MTSRIWRVLIAPGPEDEPLPVPPNAWVLDRDVRMPEEHWERVLEVAAQLDANRTERLEHATQADPESPTLEVHLPAAESQELAAFLDQVADHILDLPPLVPEATEDIPDAFENIEHAHMARDVAAVFRESLRLGQPYRAWFE